MKITLEVPDNTRAMVVTTVFGNTSYALCMNTTDISTAQLEDGAIVDAMPVEINNKKKEER